MVVRGVRGDTERLALVGLATKLGEALDIAAIGDAVSANVVEVVGAARCAVYECISGEGALGLIGSASFEPESISKLHRISTSSPLPLARAVATRCAIWIRSYEDLTEAYPRVRSVVTPAAELQPVAAVPLVSRGEVIGGIAFSFTERRAFDPDERAFICAIADMCAQAIDRARLFEAEAASRKAAEEALHRAQSADRRKDEFLAMLGHELRNPLAPIVIAVELVDVVSEQGRQARELIARQAKHMARLVDDLLDISRMTGGRIELQREPVDLESVIGRGIEQASPLLGQKLQRLRTDVPGGVRVYGDAVRLAQVFANILNNASKYSPDRACIDVTASVGAGEVAVTIRDEGIGIEPELLPHVFEIFMQAPQAVVRSQGGLGLGLAIVKKLVEMHAGTVVARSAGHGRGSELEVRLPLYRGDAVEDAADVALAAAAGATALTILVVDDNRDVARMLAAGLASRGFVTHVAHDGASALQLASTVLPDVVLLDIGLPIMDGYELCQRLAGLPMPPRVRIAVTGYGQLADRERALASGFDEHLVKPVELDVLVRAIARVAART